MVLDLGYWSKILIFKIHEYLIFFKKKIDEWRSATWLLMVPLTVFVKNWMKVQMEIYCGSNENTFHPTELLVKYAILEKLNEIFFSFINIPLQSKLLIRYSFLSSTYIIYIQLNFNFLYFIDNPTQRNFLVKYSLHSHTYILQLLKWNYTLF